MKNIYRLFATLVFAGIGLVGCQQKYTSHNKEAAISQLLVQAIEIGERVLSERETIATVALTEGTDAGALFHDTIQHRKHVDEFWDVLDEADSLWRLIPDQKRWGYAKNLMPVVERIALITEEITGNPQIQ